MNKTKPTRLNSWEVSDEFWAKVEPFVPSKQREDKRKYLRDPGAGRKPISPRIVFAAIVYVLLTGIQWKALSKTV